MTSNVELGEKMNEFAVKYERKLERLKFPLREVDSAREKLILFRKLLKSFAGGNHASYAQLKSLRDEIRHLAVNIDEALALEHKKASLGGESPFCQAAFTLIDAGLRDWTFLDLLVNTARFEIALSGIAPASSLWRDRQNILDGLIAMTGTLDNHPLATREPLDKLSEQLRAFQRNVQLIQTDIREHRLAVRLITGTQEFYDQAVELYQQVDSGKMTRAEVETQLGKSLQAGLHPLDAGRDDYIEMLIAQPLHLNNNKAEIGSRPRRGDDQPSSPGTQAG